MESQMMFLDCPAYLDEEGAVRCGLPAEVRSRFTMRSTSGPLESVMIRCPSGHWFNAPIEFLTLKNGKEQGLGSAGRAPGSGCDSRRGHEAAGCGRGAQVPPNWGSGGPARTVLLPTIWGGPRAYGSASQAGAAGPPNLNVWRTPSPVAGTNVIPVHRPPSTAREAKPCVTPIGCPRRISVPRAGDRPARTGMRSSGTTSSPGTASAVLDAADDVAGERATPEPTEGRSVCP